MARWFLGWGALALICVGLSMGVISITSNHPRDILIVAAAMVFFVITGTIIAMCLDATFKLID